MGPIGTSMMQNMNGHRSDPISPVSLRRTQERPTREQAETAVRTLIEYLGDDPRRSGLIETPARVVRMYDELRTLRDEPVRTAVFESDSTGLVIASGITVHSLCEHHTQSFSGLVTVGYLPHGVVLGLSKIPRIVQQVAAGLTIQETLTRDIARTIALAAQTPDVAVIMTAQHTCAVARGARAIGMVFRTSEMVGAFQEDVSLRAEFLRLCTAPTVP